ncbi:MAG TPA: hypothetical protein VEY06_12505 [Flavisolibacter sp.]|jgi:hypothetical protein|nr:hypothetical protein [Flavisolibacter sp.]
MDEELQFMSKNQLIEEIKKLRMGIREHRDSTGHNLCWHHPKLWSLLPEKINPKISVPEWSEFMKGCIQYRQSLDEQKPDALRTSERFK